MPVAPAHVKRYKLITKPKMIRDDLSTKLIHLTKGESGDEIFDKFISIIEQSKLIGGTGMIKGSHRCVCFTETPISKLANILSDPQKNSMKYAACGLMFNKKTIFSQGGRPVIYQKEEEYYALPNLLKWRHVTYDLDAERPTDFTWEREWRIKTDILSFTPSDVTIIFPTREWADAFIESHVNTMRKELIESDKKDVSINKIANNFKWHYIVLEDLGLPIDDQLNKITTQSN